MMGSVGQSMLNILAFSILGVTLVASEFIVDEVNCPGASPSRPTPVSVDQYDLTAGCDAFLKCELPDGGVATLRYSSIDIAKYQRFNGSRVSEEDDGRWKLTNIQSYDTGSFECFDGVSGTGTVHNLYIFVYDETGPLHVEWSTAMVVIDRNDYIPCLPTSSETTVQYTDSFGNVLTSTIDKILGVKPTQRPFGVLKCIYSYSERTDSQMFTVTSKSERFPTPTISPDNLKYHYLPNERLKLVCSVDYANLNTIKFCYPAEKCLTTPSSDCTVPTGRVSKTNLVKIGTLTSYTLIVEPTTASDNGNYTCVYNTYSDPTFAHPQSVRIYVYPEPWVMGPSGVEQIGGIAEQQVLMEVPIEAMPRPTFKWTFNSQEVKDGGRYAIEITQATLHHPDYKVKLLVSGLSTDDSGRYTLTATVDGASYSHTFELSVQGPPVILLTMNYKGNMSTYTADTQTVYVQPNNHVGLICRASRGSPTPQVDFEWQQCIYASLCNVSDSVWTPLPRERVTPDSGMSNAPYYTSTSTDSLSLSFTAQRSGWFKCTAENIVGNTASLFRVIVSVLPESSKGIGFTANTLKKASALVEDDNLLLDCYVARIKCQAADVELVRFSDGDDMTYRKSSKEITWREHEDSYSITLELQKVTLAMSGTEYACRCTKSAQGPRAILAVTAYIPPSWVKSVTTDTNITIGATQTFLCEPAGNPLPKVMWYKDGRPLITSTTVLLSENHYNLTLIRVAKNDSGAYSCVARTERAGSSPLYANFTLTVNEEKGGLTKGQVAMVVLIVIAVFAIAVVATVFVVRKYCRKKYTPHTFLLPSKDMINPDIPLDEQTDALPYDVGWEFPMSSLKLGMLLGQGAFGRVLKAEAMNIEEGVASTTVAVKAVRDHSDIEQVKALISELKILIHIGQHLNIVNLLGACTKDISKGHILVIVEFCRYGNLRSYLLKHKANFNPTMDDLDSRASAGVKLGHVSVDIDDDYLNEAGTSELHSQEKPVTLRDIMSWCYQIARGMEYLASIDYIHRDLAARNVLLADDNIVKICDFGLAKDIYKYQEYQKQTDGPLPIKWMALESLTHKVFNVTTDVWAYGVTVWELFSLAATPYPGWDIDETFIEKLKEGYRMEIPKHCTQQIYEEVMLTCWHPNPEQRPNFAELAEMMGESVDNAVKERLKQLEDPYITTRDSRTDIKIRPSSVRRRDRHDLDSGYLPTKALQKANGGSQPKQAYGNYYNTSPTAAEPSSKRPQMREKGTAEEKLPLHVQISDDDDDVDMPAMPAPSISPWERQHRLSKLAVDVRSDDSHSHHSVDSEGNVARPPSYNYVMKKSEPKALVSPLSSTASGARGSADELSKPTGGRKYNETTF